MAMRRSMWMMLALALHALHGAAWLGTVATVVVYVLGRWATDEYEWSQFLFWVPARALIVPALGGLVAVVALHGGLAIVRRAGDRLPKPRLRVARRGMLVGLGVGVAACTAHAGLVEWRWIGRLIGPPAREPSKPIVTLRFWNLGAAEGDGWLGKMFAGDPDVAIATTYRGYKSLKDFLARADDQTATYNLGKFLVATRLRLVEHGSAILNIEAGLGLDPRAPRGIREQSDPGEAAYLVFEDPFAAGPGRADEAARWVVWLVDLPSDPSLPRMRVTAEARRAIANWAGVSFRRRVTPGTVDTVGGEFAAVRAEERGQVGFPAADVMVGDFNIPRGSASLVNLSAGLGHAYDEAGVGPSGSFPRDVDDLRIDHAWLRRSLQLVGMPLVHIDHVFVAPPLRAVRYEVADMGMGTHFLQYVVLQRAD